MHYESFFVGGRRKLVSGRPSADIAFTETAPVFRNDQNGHYHVHQAYVQGFLAHKSIGTNVILHHGGGMSGAMWESTPDGREGWVTMSVESGLNTYVIDNAGRGRAGWPATALDTLGAPILRTEEEAWTLFRLGDAADYACRKSFPQQRFPVAVLDNLIMQFVPRWLNQKDESTDALLALLDRIGPSTVVAHSHGADCVLAAVERSPELFDALILIEPSALPHNVYVFAEHRIPVLVVVGDYLDCLPLWRELSVAYRKLIEDIVGCGGIAEMMDLTVEVGPGFSHLPMMDLGSEEVFGRVRDWIDHNV